MFNVLEIERKDDLSSFIFSATDPFIYVARLTFPTIATFWTTTFGVTDDTNKTNVNIGSIVLDLVKNYLEQDDINDCKSQEKSFYFDDTNQLLYIHVEHTKIPAGSIIEEGLLFGFTTDTVRYFRDIEFKPLIRSLPSISESVTPYRYDFPGFIGGTVQLANDGTFDDFGALYGNKIIIKSGDVGDDYEDLNTHVVGYVKGQRKTTGSFSLTIGDNLEALDQEYPTEEFSGTDFDETNGKLIPVGWGSFPGNRLPCFPVEDSGTKVKFRFAKAGYAYLIYSVIDGIETQITTYYNRTTDAEFELDYADCCTDGLDPANGLLDIYVSGRLDNAVLSGLQRTQQNIIRTINYNVRGIENNDSNYGPTFGVGGAPPFGYIYMDEKRPLKYWFQELSKGGGIYDGFRYEEREKINVRVDSLIGGTVAFTFTPEMIRNSEIPIEISDIYASEVISITNYNPIKKLWAETVNDDYKETAIKNYRKEKPFKYYPAGESDESTSRLPRLSKDLATPKAHITLRFSIQDYPNPHIYDRIQGTVSLLTNGYRIPDEWTYVLGNITTVLGDANGVLGEQHDVTRYEAYQGNQNVRQYYGDFDGVVIGIRWLFDTDEVEITARQRDFV